MQRNPMYLAGALSGVVFFTGVYLLAGLVEGYSHAAQTVSEIGRLGSPAQVYAQWVNLAVAALLLLFAWGLRGFARKRRASPWPAILVACYGLAQSGLALFPTPHPLHNVFGLSMIIGYLAPAVLAVSWRRVADARGLITPSWVATALVGCGVFLNLSPLFARDLYPLEYYGLVQRGLLVVFYAWCLVVGVKLFRGHPSR